MCPRLFTIYGPIAIQSYGFMIVVGLLVFLGLTYFHPRRAKLMTGDTYINAVLIALLVGVLGGRTLGVIADWPSFSANPIEVFYPWVGGFVVLGAILGIVTVMPIYLWKHNIPVFETLDFAAVYAPLMQAIARFGCLFSGCCYGAIVSSPTWFTVTFTNLEAHIPQHLLGVPLLPTQLFAAMASAFIFILMLLLRKKFTYIGQTVFFYLLSENVARFGVDFFRGDRGTLSHVLCFDLSQFQIYSATFFVICLIGFIAVSLYGKKVYVD